MLGYGGHQYKYRTNSKSHTTDTDSHAVLFSTNNQQNGNLLLHQRNLPLDVEAPNDIKRKFNHYVGNKYQAAEAMTEPSSVFRVGSWIPTWPLITTPPPSLALLPLLEAHSGSLRMSMTIVNVYFVMGFRPFRPNYFTCTAHLYLYCTLLVLHTYASYIRHWCIFFSLRNTIQSFSISNMVSEPLL